MLEDSLINSFKSLDIDKGLCGNKFIDKRNDVEFEQNDLSRCLGQFGEIIYDEDQSDNENSSNLASRGPTKRQSNKNKPVPYYQCKNISQILSTTSNNIHDLKINTQINGYLTPPSSSQLSPPKQVTYSPPYMFSSNIISAYSPESISSVEYMKDDFHDRSDEKDEDNDSGTASLSKQSSTCSLKMDLLNGIETPVGIEYPDVVSDILNQLEKMEHIYDFKDDSSQSTIQGKLDISMNSETKIKDAYIAVANMRKESLEKIDSDGDSCLLVASAKNKFHLVKALVERLQREGIFLKIINFPNKNGITALYVAVFNNNPHLVKYLVKNGANVNLDYYSKPKNKNNSLMFRLVHYVAERGTEYLDTLKHLLLSKELKIDFYNSKGETPLICAIEKHNLEKVDSRQTIMLLIQRGADILKQNNLSNKPPLQIAIEKKLPEIVKLLLQLAKYLSNNQHLYIHDYIEAPLNAKMSIQSLFEKSDKLENLQNIQYLDENQYDEDVNWNCPNKILNQYQICVQSNENLILNDTHFQPDVYINANTSFSSDYKFSEERLPMQIHQYNCMTTGNIKTNFDKQSAKNQSILDQMLNFRKNSSTDFSLLSCAYDVCASSRCENRTKEVIKLLLTYGATLAPKSKPHPVSQLPEFLGFQRKKK